MATTKTLAELSAVQSSRRVRRTVSNYTELVAAMRPGSYIVCTATITATAPIVPASSVTIEAETIVKDYDGAPLINADGDSAANYVNLYIDQISNGESGAGSMVVLAGNDCTLRALSNEDGCTSFGEYKLNVGGYFCIDTAGDRNVMLVKDGYTNDAGDFLHISGGEDVIGYAKDFSSIDDGVGLFPTATGSHPLRDIINPRITIVNGESKEARLLAFGIPQTEAHDENTASVVGLVATISGEAFTEDSLQSGNEAGVIALCNVNQPSTRVRDFYVSGAVAVGGGGTFSCPYGIQARNVSDGEIDVEATGYSTQHSFQTGCTNVTLANS